MVNVHPTRRGGEAGHLERGLHAQDADHRAGQRKVGACGVGGRACAVVAGQIPAPRVAGGAGHARL